MERPEENLSTDKYIRTCRSEVQILQGPRRYVVDTDGYLGPNGVPYNYYRAQVYTL